MSSTPVWPADADRISQAASLLRAGRLVAFPTETVYGLGANALDPDAVARIFAAKGRPSSNPLIVHVPDAAAVSAVAADWPPTAALLAARFWPGPLTLVLPKRPAVPDIVTAGGPTVAVRCPDHPVATALLRAAGVPLAAPSANRSTEVSPTRADHVLKSLDGRIDAILDGGPCRGGIESTVVDVTGGVRLLRPGLISRDMLEAVVGPIAVGPVEGVARSPGQLAKHYSPRTPVQLGGSAAGRVATVGFGPDCDRRLPDTPSGYAAELYAVLHEVDDGRFDRIIIEPPPDTPEWAAVRDRLRRAAAD